VRPADTSPEAWKVFLDLQRRIPPADKMRLTFHYSEFVRKLSEAGLRQRFPHAGDREIFLREARQRLGAEIFRNVYGEEPPVERSARAGG
jgi:hypothetical protein